MFGSHSISIFMGQDFIKQDFGQTPEHAEEQTGVHP
jgi:hypothetical protein